jgi:hypothetical protein
MCHSKQLNQYQQNNLEILDSQTLQKLKSGDWRNAPTLILKCVHCGASRITMPVVHFFNYDGTQLICWDCQHKIYGKRKQYT